MDEAAEKATILAAIANPSAVREMLEKGISQKSFGHAVYGLGWRILATLYLSGREITALSVQSEAGKDWQRIEPLVNEGVRGSHIAWEDFLPSLKAEEAVRGIDDIFNQYIGWKARERRAVHQMLPTMIHMLASVAQDSEVIDPRPAAIWKGDQYSKPWSTGLEALDGQLGGGFESSSLIVFGAPSGHGKTALAVTLAAYAIANEIPTLIFSLEMDQRSILRRVVCAHGNVTWAEASQKKGFDEGADKRLNEAVGQAQRFLRIYPSIVRSPQDMDARICWHCTEFGHIGLVLVDHIGLVRGKDIEQTNLNPAAYIGEMIYGLMDSSRRHATTIVVFSQLSEEQSREFKKKKDLAHLTFKGSGDIFNAADYSFIFMRHPERLNWGYFRKKKDRKKGETPDTQFEIRHWPQYYLFANDMSGQSEQS